VFLDALGMAALVAGSTLLARIPRLAAGPRWLRAGFLAFAMGCVLYTIAVSEGSRRAIGATFVSPTFLKAVGGILPNWTTYGPTMGMWLLALAVGVAGLVATWRSRDPDEDRRQRWILRGTRPLMLCGTLAVALIVASQLFPIGGLRDEQRAKLNAQPPKYVEIVESAGFDDKEFAQLVGAAKFENLPKVKPLLTARPPVWPVLLASAFFLYLWWLSTLVFDLAFVWQRYVRGSVLNDRLKKWSTGDRPPGGS
jgi:hypothetical protein